MNVVLLDTNGHSHDYGYVIATNTIDEFGNKNYSYSLAGTGPYYYLHYVAYPGVKQGKDTILGDYKFKFMSDEFTLFGGYYVLDNMRGTIALIKYKIEKYLREQILHWRNYINEHPRL